MHANLQSLPCIYLPVVCMFRFLAGFVRLLRVMGIKLSFVLNFDGPSANLQTVNLAEGGG